MPDYMPANARRVGVFVNEDKQTIEMFADRFSLDFIQLHGNESPEYCRSLQLSGLKLIKAFPIASRKDLQNVHNYSNFCKYFLFDSANNAEDRAINSTGVFCISIKDVLPSY